MPPDGFVHWLREDIGKVLVDGLLGIFCIVGFWLMLAAVAVLFWPASAWELGSTGLVVFIVGIGGIIAREIIK